MVKAENKVVVTILSGYGDQIIAKNVLNPRLRYCAISNVFALGAAVFWNTHHVTAAVTANAPG
jgi:hypothetical protein